MNLSDSRNFIKGILLFTAFLYMESFIYALFIQAMNPAYSMLLSRLVAVLLLVATLRVDFRKVNLEKDIFIYMLLVSVLRLLMFPVSKMLNMLIKLDAQTQNMISAFEGHNALAVLFILLASPLFEELLYRGLLQKESRNLIGKWGSIIIPSLLFALMHSSISQTVGAFLLSLILAVSYERKKNLLYPMILHTYYNLTAIIQNLN